MKLLTKPELKASVQKQLDGEFARSYELANAIALWEGKLNTLRGDYAEEGKKFREHSEQQIKVFESKISFLTDEVNALEARQREAMKPVKERMAQADEKHRTAVELLESVENREEVLIDNERDLYERIDALTIRLDELSSRETASKERTEKAKRLGEMAHVVYMQADEHAKQIEATLAEKTKQLVETYEELTREKVEVSSQREHLQTLREALEKEQAQVDSDRSKLAVAIKIAREKYEYKG